MKRGKSVKFKTVGKENFLLICFTILKFNSKQFCQVRIWNESQRIPKGSTFQKVRLNPQQQQGIT